MAKPPRTPKPRFRKTDAAQSPRIVGRATIAKPADPRQAGLFDAPLPKWIKPCLPTLVEKPPQGPQWAHEIKWDGYRVSAYVAEGKVTIRTRNGHDWTNRFPSIATALAKLKVRSAIIDGEAVVLDERGRPSFAELQADLDRHGSERAVLYAFDLLFLDGEDLRGKPLETRREALGAPSYRPVAPSPSARLIAGLATICSAPLATTNLRASFRSVSIAPIAPVDVRNGSKRNASSPTPSSSSGISPEPGRCMCPSLI